MRKGEVAELRHKIQMREEEIALMNVEIRGKEQSISLLYNLLLNRKKCAQGGLDE